MCRIEHNQVEPIRYLVQTDPVVTCRDYNCTKTEHWSAFLNLESIIVMHHIAPQTTHCLGDICCMYNSEKSLFSHISRLPFISTFTISAN